MGFTPHFRSSQRWLAAVCIVFAALLLTAQAMHVHPDNNGLSSATCPICVSAHTSAPVTAVTAQVLLVAIAAVVILGEQQTPNAESILPLFIRPPPSA
jgi:hypothetical protein